MKTLSTMPPDDVGPQNVEGDWPEEGFVLSRPVLMYRKHCNLGPLLKLGESQSEEQVVRK